MSKHNPGKSHIIRGSSAIVFGSCLIRPTEAFLLPFCLTVILLELIDWAS